MRPLRATLILLILMAGLAPRMGRAQTSTTPRFESAPCPFTLGDGITEGKDVRCGYLVVPEDRAVANGATIRLAVAIFKSPQVQTVPDPVIYLEGGPGGSGLTFAEHLTSSNLEATTGNRDLILVEQRGTRFSQPSLACPEVTAEGLRSLTYLWTKAQEATQEANAFTACRTRLLQAGVNLDAYNTVANAQDIADLRVALGYPSVNLYGISYGTRLALTVMHDFPQGIRSVVLDAVLPPGVNTLAAPGQSAARDFKLLFASCGKAENCNANHPHLKSVFDHLVQRLDKKPVRIKVSLPGVSGATKVVLTGEGFVSIVFSALYVSPFITLLPEMITRAAHGRYGLTSQIASQVVLSGIELSTGMFLSVECSDDAHFITDHDIDVAAQTLSAAVRADFAATEHRELRDCQIWNVQSVAPEEKAPVVSSIPTMLMVGEYDPITPPSYAAEVAKTLSHSYLFVYPGLGHGTRYTAVCPYGMAGAFFDDPTQKPDDSCIADMPEPFQ